MFWKYCQWEENILKFEMIEESELEDLEDVLIILIEECMWKMEQELTQLLRNKQKYLNSRWFC
jgi:hypothetical protein